MPTQQFAQYPVQRTKMFALHPDVRSKSLKFEFKMSLNQQMIQNNTITHSIYETVLDEYYVAITAPAMWL